MNKTYGLVVALVVASSMQACGSFGSGEDVAEARDGVLNQWIGPVSEEAGRNLAACQAESITVGGGPNQPIGATNAFCGGRYCDDNWLFCGSLPAGVVVKSTTRWSGFISEEAPNNQAICGSIGNVTGALDGVRATGSYSDNISIRCLDITLPTQGFNLACSWTPYFSEEQGFASFPAGSFAAGVRCSGRYCDNLSYYACRNSCQPCSSDNDCVEACIGGCCGPA